ncbi:MAG: DUF2238 domain-containing protein [Immundisolibacteraceae bacterium]|nr:DUF2238 domain-containing protein [Immundisolibacteraceae bacterium]
MAIDRMSLGWLAVFTAVLVWSGWHPHDYYTWGLEVLPAVVALGVLALTRRRFSLTPLAYQLILVHCVALMVGGHYTYAEVPIGEWFQSAFGWQRNNYDKFGHLLQGLVPALVAREVLVRLSVVRSGRWLDLFVISLALAISAFYELIEWWVALLSDQAAESFLGTQGYVWDTQSDMAMALLGALMTILLLGKRHDRQLMEIDQADNE